MERPRETGLRIGFCSRRAAEYACQNWHYSGTLPPGDGVYLGVWEEGRFVGAVAFTRGAGRTNHRAEWYGIDKTAACELARVALRSHEAPVTQVLAVAIRKLREANPGLRLIISFADPEQGHLGTIYQAGNWIYVGLGGAADQFYLGGKWTHNKTVKNIGQKAKQDGQEEEYRAWLKTLPTRMPAPKFCYLYPLDRAARRAILPHALPYPTAEQISEARAPSHRGGRVRSPGSAP